MLHIPDVTLHAPFHLPHFPGLPSVARDLRPPRNAGLDKVAHHVLVYQFGIHLRMGKLPITVAEGLAQ